MLLEEEFEMSKEKEAWMKERRRTSTLKWK